MKTKKIIHIKGMHCVSCEKLLDDEFRNISGVKDVRVDRKENMAEIFYKDVEPDFAEIKNMAKKYGYDAFEEEAVSDDLSEDNFSVWLKAILIVIGLFLAFKAFQKTGFLSSLDSNDGNITFGVAFLIGLVASVSSCLAIVGSVIIAFGEKYKAESESFFEGAVKPNLFFHIGRLGTFFVLGGLLGLIGGEINISGNFVSIFSTVIAIVMAWLGLNILGLLPSISALGVRLPKKMTGSWSHLKKSNHQLAPFVLGSLSFFLPCGFTQSMQIFALTSGSFLTGGLILLIFALGTMPSLLILGITTSWLRNRKLLVFQKVAGVLIVIFSIYTLQSGLALSGVKTSVVSNKESGAVVENKVDDKNFQVVEMRILSSGFSPNVLRLKKGVPVRWKIFGDQVSSCTNKIIVPSLNISKKINKGENVIEFTPDTVGEIPFSCWMGMVRGKFIVE
jgi:sulfite exporter TauE/SafE/copper chaperone CopZ